VSIFTKSDLPASPEPTTVEDGAITEAPPDDGSTPARRGRARRIAAWVLTGLAGLFVFVALVAPDQHTRMTLGSFVRIPVEGLIGAALLLVLPGRARKIVAALIGAFLGLLILVQALDFGFWTSLNRQFDLVADWGLLDDGVSFLRDAVGRTGANIAVVCAVVLAIAVVVFMALSMIRLSRIAARHRTRTAYGIAVLAVAWVACAMLGAQFVAGVPVAAHSEADLVHSRALMVQAGLRDKKAFAAAIAADKFHDTPADELLTGLRGKDVIVSFVESYGRSALEDPQQAAIVDPALAAGTQQLKAAGFSARSGFLTFSPPSGQAATSRRLSWATAVGIGPSVRSIVVGDRVLFDPDDRSEVELHGREYVLLRERDVHAVAASRVEPDGTGLYL
jgi:hypothetical protein